MWSPLRAPPHLRTGEFFSEQSTRSPSPGIGVGSGSVGTLAWNLSPVLVAMRGKMKSLGSVMFPIRKALGHSVRVDRSGLTEGIFRNSVDSAGGTRPSRVSTPSSRKVADGWTHPKYLKGHIPKCLISAFSSCSASLRSFRGRPGPRARVGALGLLLEGVE